MNTASQRDEVRSPATDASETPPPVDRAVRSAAPTSPSLAAVLSLLAPGAGHLHAWHPALAGAAWILSTAVNATVLVVLLAPTPRAAVMVVVGGCVSLYVAISVHAWRIARDNSARTRPTALVRAACALAFIVGSWGVGMSAERWAQRGFAASYRVSSASMAPTLLADEWILATTYGDIPRPGRLIIYRRSGNSYVKRLVGIAGDTLAMRQRRVFRNAREVPEPYVSYDRRRIPAVAATWGPLVVPAGKVFVLGDNRNNALDSRHFGFIDADSVVGFPARIYFSRDPVTGAIRWRRIGRPLPDASGIE